MTETDGSIDWRMLREFVAVDLTRSFVLSWEAVTGTLMIDVDLYLTPDHPFFEKPRPAEKVCIRPAVIEFPFCEGLESNDVAATTDLVFVVGKLGHGAIKGLRRLADGRYEIDGKFGVIRIDAERPLVRLKGA